MLEGFSADFGISPEQFVAMCDDGLSTGTFDEVSTASSIDRSEILQENPSTSMHTH